MVVAPSYHKRLNETLFANGVGQLDESGFVKVSSRLEAAGLDVVNGQSLGRKIGFCLPIIRLEWRIGNGGLRSSRFRG